MKRKDLTDVQYECILYAVERSVGVDTNYVVFMKHQPKGEDTPLSRVGVYSELDQALVHCL